MDLNKIMTMETSIIIIHNSYYSITHLSISFSLEATLYICTCVI